MSCFRILSFCILFSVISQFEALTQTRQLSTVTEGFLRWHKKAQLDSLKLFLSTKEYLLYDEVQIILNHINQIHFHNKTEEAELFHSTLQWLGKTHQEVGPHPSCL